MTARLFNPGPGPFASPTGGVFAPAEHFDGDPDDPRLAQAIERGHIIVVEAEVEAELPPADPDAKPLEPVNLPGLPNLTDADGQSAPKPGPPASKRTQTAKKED